MQLTRSGSPPDHWMHDLTSIMFHYFAGPHEIQGFVMALDYSDQMTAASANVMNLQCFIGHHVKGVKVIEPFINPKGSLFGVSLSPSYTMSQGYKLKLEEINSVKLSDVLDINEWQHYASSRKYSPLVSWSNFTKDCPKKLILVYHKWGGHCNPSMMVNATREFVIENNFEEIRNVCIDFRKTGILSHQDFVETIYGHFKPSESVVVFNKWGGIENHVSDFRYSIKGTPCTRGHEIHLFHHSTQISKDVKEYSMRYMNKTERYVAVMVRLEHFALKHNFSHLSTEFQHSKLNRCFNDINKKVKTLKQERTISGTLLTMDVGKYGCSEFRLKRARGAIVNLTVLNQTVRDFFKSFFNNSMTQDIWEESFESVAKFHVPGYIAIMQKVLAASSVCLLLAGGGSFQGNANKLYNELHSADSKCVFHVC